MHEIDQLEASDYHSSMHDRLAHRDRDLLRVSVLAAGSMSLTGGVAGPFRHHPLYEVPESSSRATLMRRRRWRSAPLKFAAMKVCV